MISIGKLYKREKDIAKPNKDLWAQKGHIGSFKMTRNLFPISIDSFVIHTKQNLIWIRKIFFPMLGSPSRIGSVSCVIDVGCSHSSLLFPVNTKNSISLKRFSQQFSRLQTTKAITPTTATPILDDSESDASVGQSRVGLLYFFKLNFCF